MPHVDIVLRRVVEHVNNRDYDALSADLSDDVVHHTNGGDVSGRDAALEFYRQLSDDDGWTITLHDTVSTDDWGVAIHRNQLGGQDYEVVTVAKMREGRIIELWTVGDGPPMGGG